MTWAKLSDDFPDDCETLTVPARWLHVEGLCWSNRKLLDCRIPKAHLRKFATNPECVTELVATGWWIDEGDAYVIRHHAGYQRTREQVLAQQAANAVNGKKGGRPRGGTGTPREISEVPPPRTQSVNESPNESKTERDGTGSGRTGTYGTEINNGDGEYDNARPDLAPIPGSDDGLTAQQRAQEQCRRRVAEAERRRQQAATR